MKKHDMWWLVNPYNLKRSDVRDVTLHHWDGRYHITIEDYDGRCLARVSYSTDDDAAHAAVVSLARHYGREPKYGYS